MGKYVLLYKGGTMGESEAEQQAQMELWMSWFGSLGEALVDPGNPFGPSAEVGGSGGAAASGIGGYSIISAESLEEASGKAKGCPLLESGGTVEVHETIAIG